MEDDKYVKQLENCIEQMIRPMKNIPFNLIIKSMFGYEVEFFDFNNKQHIKTLEILKNVGFNIVNKTYNFKGRPNEFGNQIEIIVKNEMNKLNLNADIPTNSQGKKAASGYPDIAFELENKIYYLECKTFNKKNVNDSFRTFYFSPEKHSKITANTVHFLFSFEVEKRKDCFYVKSYKIISLNSLYCNLKSEFNASNKELYSNNFGARILFESNNIQ